MVTLQRTIAIFASSRDSDLSLVSDLDVDIFSTLDALLKRSRLDGAHLPSRSTSWTAHAGKWSKPLQTTLFLFKKSRTLNNWKLLCRRCHFRELNTKASIRTKSYETPSTSTTMTYKDMRWINWIISSASSVSSLTLEERSSAQEWNRLSLKTWYAVNALQKALK